MAYIKTHKQPLISIIVPSYNQGRYIERVILSVLRQDYPAKELIVADRGSTDETIEVLKRYPQVKWLSGPDRGYADAVNKGLGLARGNIIGIQSSDDYYAPGTLTMLSTRSSSILALGIKEMIDWYHREFKR